MVFENVRQVIFGTKLFVLFPAIPMAFVAQRYSYGRPWIFALSLIRLTPLAERLSFLTDKKNTTIGNRRASKQLKCWGMEVCYLFITATNRHR
ncbi:hypothetical protein Ccrd_006783 [Cynara cardunculus var. scolymus]|uniref:Uncharacterized protein n=1 Tax=Cynara cardunculus var. scolymus TaxID=59895 RepID=A0A103XI83_CYNCS|nr:hypothetical protein Ccrd_006783 [Cynara cardunculus var. scolymus]